MDFMIKYLTELKKRSFNFNLSVIQMDKLDLVI